MSIIIIVILFEMIQKTHFYLSGVQMEFESLFTENDVDDVEVLPQEHNERSVWYDQPDIEFQIPVAEPIIPQGSDLNPLFLYPQEDSFTSEYISIL